MIPDPCFSPGHGPDIPSVKLLQQLTTQQYDIHMFPLSGLWHQAYLFISLSHFVTESSSNIRYKLLQYGELFVTIP